MKAVVDPNFFANLTLSFGSEDGETELGIEEAWLQTTGLPYGMTVRAGRFFSEAGYLNKFHVHADDFADRPLPYQAFFGGQYVADGAQLRWVDTGVVARGSRRRAGLGRWPCLLRQIMRRRPDPGPVRQRGRRHRVEQQLAAGVLLDCH